MSKKGFEMSVNFILGFVLICIVIGAVALWLYFGEGGGLKGKLADYISNNIVKKLGG